MLLHHMHQQIRCALQELSRNNSLCLIRVPISPLRMGMSAPSTPLGTKLLKARVRVEGRAEVSLIPPGLGLGCLVGFFNP